MPRILYGLSLAENLKGIYVYYRPGGNYKMKFFRKFLNNAADYSMGRAVEENGLNRLHL